jgi:hypothetical protein
VFSLTITRSTLLAAPLTLFTGRTLAYRPMRFLSATIGLE